MPEELDLTTPVVESKTTDTFKVVSIMLNSEMGLAQTIPNGTPPPPGMVAITVKDNNGATKAFQYGGLLAQDMIKFINTGDFTTRSLHKRILEKLAANGDIVGTVTGTPDVPSGTPTGLE